MQDTINSFMEYVYGVRDRIEASKLSTIRIGLTAPLSGSDSVYGNAMKNGALLAISEINANGGLNGKELELLAYDENDYFENISYVVYQLYEDLMEDKMQVSLGSLTTES